MNLSLKHDATKSFVWVAHDGSIWWYPGDNKPSQLLEDADSLCGIFPFETGVDDVFRPACSAHDNFYRKRALFENWGFDREWMDDHFLTYMLDIAGSDTLLRLKAYGYFKFVREVGWIFYYRHPGGNAPTPGLAKDSIIVESLNLHPRYKLMLNYVP